MTTMKISRSLLLCALGLAPLLAQPAFEVASIKPNDSGNGSSFIQPTAGRLRITNMTVKSLVMFAYQVRDFQISGAPPWLDGQRYDIEAKAAGNENPEQLRAMLQTLLRDRFALSLRHETKELPIYELTVAKGGLKIQPLQEGGCVAFRPEAPERGANICGSQMIGRGQFDAANITMPDLATAFSFMVGRTVTDRTGVSGVYPVHLKFAPENAPPESDAPSIFTAVQERLGLKLEAARGPVEVLAIDSVEKPSRN